MLLHVQVNDSNPASAAQKLYVMERVQIQSSEMDQSDDLDLVNVMLSCDPANPHGYFVTSVKGVYCVHMPWLGKLEAFATTATNCMLVNNNVRQFRFVVM